MPVALAAATMRTALLASAGEAAAAGVVSATVVTLTEGVMKAMLVAKLKTAAVVLVGVAALGMGTGGLVYQSRVGAADPLQATTKAPQQGTEKARDPVTNRQIDRNRALERARQIAEDAELRGQKLRDELEVTRRELEATREQLRRLMADLNAQRRQEEVQRHEAERMAQKQLAELRDRLEVDRQLQEKQAQEKAAQDKLRRLAEVREEEARQKAPAGAKDRPSSQIGNVNPQPLETLQLREREQTLLVEKLKQEQVQTNARLEEELAKLQKMRLEIRKVEEWQKVYPTQAGQAPGAPAGDKLDRILEQLERLDKRLSRLEERVK
jgi:hypothetical protein